MKTIDLSKWEMCKFVPHQYSTDLFLSNGCGANTLSLLVGKQPGRFKSRPDWTPQYMLGCLHAHRIRSRRLNTLDIVNVGKDVIGNPINGRLVLLLRMRFNIQEASWLVSYNMKLYHNFEISTIRPFEFINHPIMEMYALSSLAWRPVHIVEAELKAKLEAKGKKKTKFQGPQVPG